MEKIPFFPPKKLGETSNSVKELGDLLHYAAKELKERPKNVVTDQKIVEKAPTPPRVVTLEDYKRKRAQKAEEARTVVPNTSQPRLFSLKKRTNRGGIKVKKRQITKALSTLRKFKINLCESCITKINEI